MATKKTKKENTEVKDVVIATPAQGLNQIFGINFGDVNLNELNNTIESLAEHSETLSAEEKTAAIGIIDSWNKNVVQRLYAHRDDMNQFTSFFGGYYNNLITENQQLILAKYTHTEILFSEYLQVKREFDKLKEAAPVVPDADDDMSKLEIAKAYKDYEYNRAVYNNQFNKVNRRFNKAYKAWLDEVKKDPEITAALDKSNKYNRNLNKLINDCESKANLAKLNVTISSSTVRDSLKSLLDFVTTI